MNFPPHNRVDSAISLKDSSTHEKQNKGSIHQAKSFNVFSPSAAKELATLSYAHKIHLRLQPKFPINRDFALEIWNAFQQRTYEHKSNWNFINFDSKKGATNVCRFRNVPLVAATAIKNRFKSGFFSVFSKREWLHANEVNFFGGRKFIASQCPTKNEHLGFLRMLKQHKVSLIVDLASESDYKNHLRDSQYIPPSGYRASTIDDSKPSISQCLDHHETRLVGKSSNRPKRVFVNRLQIADGRSQRHALQRIHCPDWPDHEVISSEALRELADTVEANVSSHSHPILVHCSAGVGRTGTLISYMAARDIIRTAIKKGKTCDTESIVKTALQVMAKGRIDRGPAFIQSPGQFELVINTLIEDAGNLLGWQKLKQRKTHMPVPQIRTPFALPLSPNLLAPARKSVQPPPFSNPIPHPIAHAPIFQPRTPFDADLLRWTRANSRTENRPEAMQRIHYARSNENLQPKKAGNFTNLNLANLGISCLPQCFLELHKLRTIDLRGNPIMMLPDLRNLANLETIFVSPQAKEYLFRTPLRLPPRCRIVSV